DVTRAPRGGRCQGAERYEDMSELTVPGPGCGTFTAVEPAAVEPVAALEVADAPVAAGPPPSRARNAPLVLVGAPGDVGLALAGMALGGLRNGVKNHPSTAGSVTQRDMLRHERLVVCVSA